MPSRPEIGRRPGLGHWRLALAALVALPVLLASCAQSGSAPLPAPGLPAVAPVELPERCRGDGAVQTWLLLPLEQRPSDLLAAYQEGQVIEFRATVIGQDDNPALQPHRRFMLREAAEGLTLLLDYQGDPPPLIQGQSYRFIAWADLLPAEQASPAATPPSDPRALIPASRGYELQVFDSAGLLFWGRTDVEEQDDPLGVRFSSVDSACPAVPAPQNDCVQSRQTLPLKVSWNGDELTLYPGEDDLLAHQGATYAVALFRNRQVVYAEPPCAGYNEHRRSLRMDRVDPLPMLPTLAPITATITTTLAITPTAPLTETAPLPSVP